MAALNVASIPVHFTALDDPRVEHNKLHHLRDIITIAVCGVIGGADTWVEIAAYGQMKLAWLRTLLELPHGIPSHDTFGRVFARRNPERFQACLLAWVQATFASAVTETIAIDGKTRRRSYDRATDTAALHMVSAWAAAQQLVLGQVDVDGKSNEITAIPLLIDALDIEGCTVTIDAMGCQKEIAAKIVGQGGDYVLALKKNQRHLYEDSVAAIAAARATGEETRAIAYTPKGRCG